MGAGRPAGGEGEFTTSSGVERGRGEANARGVG